MTRPLSPAAVDVLDRSTVTDTAVTLPPALDRRLYEEIDKTLRALGGKWNRGARAHLFDRDPREGIALAVATGEVPADLDRLLSWWPTPPQLAKRVVAELDDGAWDRGGRILEPSAGEGALADEVRHQYPSATVITVEPDPRRHAALLRGGHLALMVPFEEYATEVIGNPAHLYDAIVMNPPFTTPGDRHAWVTHVELAVQLLGAGGRLAAILPRSVESRQMRRVERLRAVAARSGRIESLPDDAFVPVGTSVRTSLYVVDAPHGGAELFPDLLPEL